MRFQTVLCMALAAVAVAAEAGFDEMRNLNLAVVASSPNAPQSQNPGGQAHENGNDGNKQGPADKDKSSHANGNPQNTHEAGKNNPRESKGPTPSNTATSNQHGKDGGQVAKHSGDDNDDGEDKKTQRKEPTKTHKSEDKEEDDDDDDGGDEEMEKKYRERAKADKDAGRMPGRMKMVVPPRTVHTPLFELDSVVELQWEYDKNVVEVPENLMISVQLPKDPHADPGTKPVLYDIAVNVTGKQKKFFWDTKNDIPEGVGMREGSGYTMYFYDGDIGFRMSDVVPAGYLIKYAMPFAFYISRYERTNDGVPRNYNPNNAARPVPVLHLTMTLILIASATLHFWS
ncbi:hypothetical protein COEREDRAFT_5804 [Coemansia reversa NRRL 1564]|uniref:DUF7137 domain-containing protein n=1 Tax=Coemansia reversa (strain ATCC 12441 / NRRL 1564) TaxID=763665 RepID=A0A2G5BJV5_COERN|nr:hypothetical protein COEREDRAFT_5804 [Coemansia reversa NRRL 1564]|eukprot:PIA19290.1 hypothetical protein COEREDRAFT_5804 [Coemansia reversa NRRL 1564]